MIAVQDSFTGSNGTAIASHTGEIGATWGEGYLGGAGVLFNNRLRGNTGGGFSHFAVSGVVPVTPNYDVEADVFMASIGTTFEAGVAGRASNASDTSYYRATYSLLGGNARWELYVFSNGTPFLLGFANQTLSANTSYHLKLSMVNSTIRVIVDGVTAITVTDTTVSAGAYSTAYFYDSGTPSDNTGVHLDNFTVTSTGFWMTAVGDSITADAGASTGVNGWRHLLAAAQGWTPLLGTPLSATQIIDQVSAYAAASQIFTGDPAYADNRWCWLSGYNDMRLFGTDANGLETYQRTLRAALAWAARLDGDKLQGNNGGWTKVGSWTGTVIANLNTTYTSTQNDTATIAAAGTAITICLMSRLGLGDGGVCQVKIDGAVVDSNFDTAFGSASGYSSGVTVAVPMAKRYSGLSAGSHTVELKLLTAGGKVLQICFVTGNGEASGSHVYVGTPPKMNATGYTSFSPYNAGSDAAVALYEAAIRSVLADLNSDGHAGYYADVNAFYLTASDVSGDNVHPNDAGHSHIKDAFLAAATVGGSGGSRGLFQASPLNGIGSGGPGFFRDPMSLDLSALRATAQGTRGNNPTFGRAI